MTFTFFRLDSASNLHNFCRVAYFESHSNTNIYELQVKERVNDSMYALGMPISQGAITTILGVIGLGLAPSYIFITFFKMVLLVIVLGALHGLILLPVLLSFLGPETCCGAQQNNATSEIKKKPKHLVAATGTQTNLEEAVDVSMLRPMQIPRPQCSR